VLVIDVADDMLGSFAGGHGEARCWRMGARKCSVLLGISAGVVLVIGVAEDTLGSFAGVMVAHGVGAWVLVSARCCWGFLRGSCW